MMCKCAWDAEPSGQRELRNWRERETGEAWGGGVASKERKRTEEGDAKLEGKRGLKLGWGRGASKF